MKYVENIAINLAKVVENRGIRVDANCISEVHLTISDLLPLCYDSCTFNTIVKNVVSIVDR